MTWLTEPEARTIRDYARAVHGRRPFDDPSAREACRLVLEDFLRRFLSEKVHRGRPVQDLSRSMPVEVAWLREHLSPARDPALRKVLARILLSGPATLTVRGSPHDDGGR